ncbi:MBL fold metallo-hydrolase [Candidatus Bipolaricaulota bacterium]|nr:MBL fold metallo-hydrolase [Candidatus Bipolaricaulota bacterium]TFH11592.1 MAG: MBL fold metallo-hydrolase [Candidatus Atribacteria bacterium]
MIKTFHTGGDRNLGYLVVDDSTNEGVVIDPSYDPGAIATFALEHGKTIVYAFNTHDHHDHTNGNEAFAAATGIVPLKFGELDAQTSQRVAEGAAFPLGDLQIQIIHTPGHTTDSICLLIGDAVFTGDTLFVGKVGGTDLEEGARAEYASIHDKLLTLPDETRVFPGHDVGTTPESTIQHERETNPFLIRPTVEAFIDLKAHWAEYKKEHGIA